MLFFLSAAEYTNIQNNTTKVKVHLTDGLAEVLEYHQDLMGRVDNNLVEIETVVENRVEKLVFVVQDAVFIVSNKGLGADREKNQSVVYVYAKRAQEITPTVSLEEISKEYEIVLKQFEKLQAKLALDSTNRILKAKTALVENEVNFFIKVISMLKMKK